MRISAGLAEINLSLTSANRIAPEKTYIWPVYDNGKVNSIHGVTRRTESNGVYAKPLPEEHIRLLEELLSAPAAEYTSRGSAGDKRAVVYQPGTFFDALA